MLIFDQETIVSQMHEISYYIHINGDFLFQFSHQGLVVSGIFFCHDRCWNTTEYTLLKKWVLYDFIRHTMLFSIKRGKQERRESRWLLSCIKLFQRSNNNMVASWLIWIMRKLSSHLDPLVTEGTIQFAVLIHLRKNDNLKNNHWVLHGTLTFSH